MSAALSTGADMGSELSSAELKQRSALEKAVLHEDQKIKNTILKNKNIYPNSRTDKAKFNDDLEFKKSAKLDKSIIQLSLLFYTILFLGSKTDSFSNNNYFLAFTNNINSKFNLNLHLFSFDKFYKLSYQYMENNNTNNNNYYDIGLNDIYFTVFWIINLLFLRSFLIVSCFRPCAKLLGIKKFKATQRFIEQTWSIIYYSISWSFGFYLYYKSDYFFNCYNIYKNWPHDRLSAEFKFYYLVQTACWFQQSIVIHLEAKRKDYIQMTSHHIITCLLCTGSYIYYFTRIGHIILLLMDILDVFLSTAKILKYCGFQQICDIMFVIFMISWIVLRHGVYNYVLYYSWANARDIMDFDCSNFVNPSDVKICYTNFQINFLLILLGFLQIIMCIWMYMILRVAIRVIRGGSADDVRSDSDFD